LVFVTATLIRLSETTPDIFLFQGEWHKAHVRAAGDGQKCSC